MKTNPPGAVLVSGAALSAVWQATAKLEMTKSKVATLFHLMHAHCSLEDSSGVMAEDDPRLTVGMMSLCQQMVEELDACYDEALQAARAVKGGAK